MTDYMTSETATLVMLITIFAIGLYSMMKWLYKASGIWVTSFLSRYLRGIYWVKSPKGFMRFKTPQTAQEYDKLLDVIHQLDLKLVREGILHGTAKAMHTDLEHMLERAPFEYRNGKVVAIA